MSIDVFGVGGALALGIPFAIGALKKYAKLGTGWCPIVAFLLGAVGGILAHLLKMDGAMTAFQATLAGIAIGGTSTGLYDLKKQISDAVLGDK